MRPGGEGLAILAFKTGAAASNFALLVLTARLFGVEFRGEVAIFSATVQLVALVVGFAGGASIVFLAARDADRHHVGRLLAASWVFAVLVPLAIAALARVLGTSLGRPEGWLVLVTILQALLLVHTYVLLAGRAAWQASLLEFLRPFGVVAATGAYAALRGFRSPAEFYPLWGAASALALAASLPPLWRHWRSLPAAHEGPRASTVTIVRRLVANGALAQASNVAQFLNYRSLFFALERHAGVAAVGLFSTAVSLAEVLWIPANSIATVTLNRVSREPHAPGTRALVLRQNRLAVWAMLAAAAVAASVPVAGLAGLLGRDFGGVRAILVQLLPGVVALGASLVVSSYNAGHGLYARNLGAALAGLAVTGLGYFVLIPRLGAPGAVWAMNLSYVAITAWLLVGFVRRERVGPGELLPRLADLRAVRGEERA